MSTISSGINSLTSASLIDFYQRLWRQPDLSEKNQLKIARLLTFAYGALVMVLAFLVQRLGTLLEATNKVIGLIGGPLIGLFLLGVLSRRATARGAMIGWIGGLVLTLWICFGTRVSFLWYAMAGCLATLAIGYVTSRLDAAPEAKQLEGLTLSERVSAAE
jgi:sodium-coupled monocarboxylate transporter 8/12